MLKQGVDLGLPDPRADVIPMYYPAPYAQQFFLSTALKFKVANKTWKG